MTFIEGLIVWAVIFIFFAFAARYFIRGSFYVFAQPSGLGDAERQRIGQKAVQRMGYKYVAASLALSLVAYGIMVAAGF